MEKNTTQLGIKVWIEGRSGETLFGEGQIQMLETIAQKGSINAAAKSLGMGYRSLWGRLKKMEKRIGQPLLIRQKGGISGGRSILTRDAVTMIEQFRQLQQQISAASNSIFNTLYP